MGKWAAWGSKELEEDCEGGATEMGHFLGGGKGAPSLKTADLPHDSLAPLPTRSHLPSTPPSFPHHSSQRRDEEYLDATEEWEVRKLGCRAGSSPEVKVTQCSEHKFLTNPKELS